MKDLFRKYLHSVINPEEFERFSDFIKEKENTHTTYQLMEPEWHKFMEADAEPNIEKSYILQKIIRQISQDEVNSALRKVKVYSLSLRVAALLVLGLLISSIWFYTQSHHMTGADQMQTVSIPYGAKTQLVMPDGSTVWLNSGSTLSYSGNFSRKRQVILNGEAFFDVQKSTIPFEVNTNYGKISVLGTAFNVLAYPESGFVTTLVRGSVQIDIERNKQKQVLGTGEQVELIGNELVKTKVDTELFTSWKDGKMILRREPFPSMMKRLERWFNVKIDYSPDDFKGLWYSGTIEMETITEVMDMVSTAALVRYSFDSKTRVIKIIPIDRLNNY
jgi:ferric-dicitrate binding protein FerR (iron transport regulator)